MKNTVKKEAEPVKISISFVLSRHPLVGIEGPGGHTNLVDEQKFAGVYATAARLAGVCGQSVVPIYCSDEKHPGCGILGGELFCGKAAIA